MAARKEKNIIRYKRPIRVNVGLALFLFIFVYLVILTTLYLTRKEIRFYQVEAGAITQEETVTALILRDEQVRGMDASGTVDFFLNEGDMADRSETLYTIDVNGTFSEKLHEAMAGMDSFPESTVREMKKELYEFRTSYDDLAFSDVYLIRRDLEMDVLNSLGQTALDSLRGSETFVEGTAEVSGLVSFALDGYEFLKEADITAASFDRSEYTRTVHRSGELLSAGTPILKTITDQSFSLIWPVSDEDYQDLYELSVSDLSAANKRVTFTILSTGQNVSAPFHLFTAADGTKFCSLDVPKYGARYTDDRFLDIKLVKQKTEGLKIPESAVITQSFYVIPKEYAAYGGNQNTYGFLRRKAGEETPEFISPTFYSLSADGYYYVNQKDFAAGDTIYLPDSDQTFVVAETRELVGAFNINRGYAVFRQVEILEHTENMLLIRSGTPYGLAVYDHIVQENRGVKEFDVIY